MAKTIKKTNENTNVKTNTRTRGRRDLSDVNPELTDSFIQEVDEDVKNDNLKELWNRYGLFVIAVVVLAVSAAVSFDKLQAWQTMRNQNRTETYMAATKLQDSPEETIAALQKISQDNQGIFSDFAKLQIANVLLEENKQEEALAALEKLAGEQQVNSEVKNIALVKLATYKVDTMAYEDLKQLLQPVLIEGNSWMPLAQDLLAMSAIKSGDLENARSIYENILKIKELPEDFRAKIQDMLSSISDM